jgi:hypothetical protein
LGSSMTTFRKLVPKYTRVPVIAAILVREKKLYMNIAKPNRDIPKIQKNMNIIKLFELTVTLKLRIITHSREITVTENR